MPEISAPIRGVTGVTLMVSYWTERKGSSYRTFADLKGKKIAATPGTSVYVGVIVALEKFGLTKDDVQTVALQRPDGLEPDWSIAELWNNAHVLYIDDTLPGAASLMRVRISSGSIPISPGSS